MNGPRDGRWRPERASGARAARRASAVATEERPVGYYGQPLVKRPLWRWHIALYFFLEGISGAAFVLAAAARGDTRLQRAGRLLALATLVPCPVLLTADLGRPARFHHMLRVWKPSSPMNTGAWALTAYSVPVAGLALAALPAALPGPLRLLRGAARWLPAPLLEALGVPLALTMIAYPGVLLATTSNPLWSQSLALGPLLASSAFASGAAALSLAVSDPPAAARLERVERLAAGAEAAALAGLLAATPRRAAAPLVAGRYAPHLWGGAVGVGLLAPALLRRRRGRAAAARALCVVAGSLALKWALVHAGRHAADSAAAAHEAMRQRPADRRAGLTGARRARPAHRPAGPSAAPVRSDAAGEP